MFATISTIAEWTGTRTCTIGSAAILTSPPVPQILGPISADLVLQSFVHLNGALASDYLEPAATNWWPRALTEQSRPNLPVTVSSKLRHCRIAKFSIVIHSYQGRSS